MKHSQTIAMARGLLAEGRAVDVAHMLEPLVAPLPDHTPEAYSAEQVALRCLLARVRLLCYGDAPRARALLKAFDTPAARDTLPPAVRAEATLWLGWTYTWPTQATHDGARALDLLTEAERLFGEEMDTTGRCWALLGTAWAYIALNEYPLMQQTLHDVVTLQQRGEDTQTALWALDLHVLGAYIQGRYAQALAHTAALADHARQTNDVFAIGRARAYEAVLLYALGRSPDTILEAAAEAETQLQHVAVKPGYALYLALRAALGALMRKGAWDQAEKQIEKALQATADQPAAAASFLIYQARLDLRRGRVAAAEACLNDAEGHVQRHRHRVSASRLALARCAFYAHQERWTEAHAWAERACRLVRETGSPGRQLWALLHLTRINLARGDVEAAHHTLNQTQRYSDHFSVLPVAALRFLVLGDFARAEHDLETARSNYEQACSAYTLIGDVHRTAHAQHVLSSLAPSTDTAHTRTRLDAAYHTFEPLEASPEREAATAGTETQANRSKVSAVAEDVNLGALLARASLSVDLVAETWLKAAAPLLPGRWLGVYRCDEGHPWMCVREQGSAPAVPTTHEPCGPRLLADNILWIRLRSHPGPAFFFGVALDEEANPAWQAAYTRLKPWLPVVSLALDHALLRAERLDGAQPQAPSAREESVMAQDGFVFASPAMREIVAYVHRIRTSHSPVLITGERGTGKALLARFVHDRSERREAPFETFACANVTEEQFEHHLFGRADGSPGALHAADGGTLLLADVDALPHRMQHRLLHFLENGYMLPHRAAAPVPVDVRLVATTSEDLPSLARKGRFLDTLLVRLKVIRLSVPPLRERREEIPLLVRHFFNTLRLPDAPLPTLTNQAVDTLLHYDWPGNIRQLRNEIERVLLVVRSEPAPLIDVKDLSPALLDQPKKPVPSALMEKARNAFLRPEHTLDQILADTEKMLIERVLTEHGGHVTASADALNLTRQGLYKKMKRLGIDPSAFHPVSTES